MGCEWELLAGTPSGGVSNRWLFWEQLVANSTIHKAASLMASWLCLVLFHHSTIPLKNVPLV